MNTGDYLGRYRIVRRIGVGGMGEVFLAEDQKLNRQIAVKVLSADFASDQDRMMRFVHEAISASAFSTENWSRSPDEVKFLMGFNRDVIRRRRDEMHELGVRVRWAGRAPKLWKSVIKELQVAEEMTRDNDVLTLTMCVNYGGRTELTDAVRALAEDVAAGRMKASGITEKAIQRNLYAPELPDVDLFIRSSGEQRTSNFMLWQSAYAEMVFLDTLWPDFDRRHLWRAVEQYARRDRRFGGAKDSVEVAASLKGEA